MRALLSLLGWRTTTWWRNRKHPACGCVSRCVVCTGCVSVQAIVSRPCVLCVFVHGALRRVTVTSEGARLPTLRGDTRSGRAMHIFPPSPLQALHSEIPKLSPILAVNFLDVPQRRYSVSLCTPTPSRHTCIPRCGPGLRPLGPRRPGRNWFPSGPFVDTAHHSSQCSTPVREETKIQSRLGNASARPDSLLLEEKCSCHDRRRLHPSEESVQMWIVALCDSGARARVIRPNLRWLLHLQTSFILCVSTHSMMHME